MRRILICTAVLGGGTALVFGAAAITSILVPPGRVIPQAQGVMIERAISANNWIAPVARQQADSFVALPAWEEDR
jgi:hypothetical protein